MGSFLKYVKDNKRLTCGEFYPEDMCYSFEGKSLQGTGKKTSGSVKMPMLDSHATSQIHFESSLFWRVWMQLKENLDTHPPCRWKVGWSFRTSQNISAASEKSSVAAFSERDRRRWGLVPNIKNGQNGSTKLDRLSNGKPRFILKDVSYIFF